jgi:hypothetical protein
MQKNNALFNISRINWSTSSRHCAVIYSKKVDLILAQITEVIMGLLSGINRIDWPRVICIY